MLVVGLGSIWWGPSSLKQLKDMHEDFMYSSRGETHSGTDLHLSEAIITLA